MIQIKGQELNRYMTQEQFAQLDMQLLALRKNGELEALQKREEIGELVKQKRVIEEKIKILLTVVDESLHQND